MGDKNGITVNWQSMRARSRESKNAAGKNGLAAERSTLQHRCII